MRGKSSISVVIKSADRNAVRKAVESYVEELQRGYPEVECVIWFGSWVDGLPSPGSDADLCLILSATSESARDRISKYLPSHFPVGVDLFSYTRSEFESLREEFPQWYGAITSGLEFKLRHP